MSKIVQTEPAKLDLYLDDSESITDQIDDILNYYRTAKLANSATREGTINFRMITWNLIKEERERAIRIEKYLEALTGGK